jgi:hypothetical protein
MTHVEKLGPDVSPFGPIIWDAAPISPVEPLPVPEPLPVTDPFIDNVIDDITEDDNNG